METKEILAELERDYKPTKSSKKDESSIKADKFNAVCIFKNKETLFQLSIKSFLLFFYYMFINRLIIPLVQ